MPTRLFAIAFALPAILGAQSADAWSGLREINPPDSAPQRVEAIVGATLIDGRGGTPVEDSVVLVENGRIKAVGSSASVRIAGSVKRTDAGGRYLLPGMLDAHFHTQDPARLDRVLAAGFTSIRDPGRPLAPYLDGFLQPERPLPRTFLTGPHFDQTPHAYPKNAVDLQTEQEVRELIDELAANGASAIKIYFRLPLDLIRVACRQADRHGIPVTAHLELVRADDAIRAGLDGVEHVTSLGTALADESDAREFERRVRADNDARDDGRYWLWSRLQLSDNPKIDALFALMRERNVYLTPTLRPFDVQPDDEEATEERLAGFAKMQELTRMAFEAGIPVIASSHGPTPEANWRELELLVDSGFTPSEALHTALLPAARFFGAADRIGSIEVGKVADLVLLNANPLVDIANIRSVDAVMLNGAWLADLR